MKKYVIAMITVAWICLKKMKKIKYLPGEKSLKAPFIAYADLECLLEKVQSSQNNPKNPHTERKAKHESSGQAWSLICSFDDIKNKSYFYREKDCIVKYCKDIVLYCKVL